MGIITTINPATDKVLQTFTKHTMEEVEIALQASKDCFRTYRNISFEQRRHWMMEAARILERRKQEFARTITLEMGKPIASAIAEVEKCAWVCRFYAEHAENLLSDEIIATDASKSFVTYQPLGTILAVMPWNYPLWQVFRFVAPALMAGNVGLLKHASNVPQCALHIQEIMMVAGFPSGAFTTLLIGSDQVASLIDHPVVKAVTLTGSESAGMAVAERAGRALKKCVLELGGSDPYIVLADADLTLAVEQCVTSRLLNAGQSCIGAKRFIVVEDVYDAFVDAFYQRMKSATMGDPMTNVDIGPMARKDLRDEVHLQVTKSISLGAKLLLGGVIPQGNGSFYPPTILVDVKPGQPLYEEEVFGPVAAVIRAKDEAEAIDIANDTPFGLGACIFTADIKRGEAIATNQLEAGCCFVNQFVKSDPRLPFGGIKRSGYGRELSRQGILEFVNTKTVYVR